MKFVEGANEKLAVIALGGNAIINKGERGDIHEQFANTRRSMGPIVELMKRAITSSLLTATDRRSAT